MRTSAVLKWCVCQYGACDAGGACPCKRRRPPVALSKCKSDVFGGCLYINQRALAADRYMRRRTARAAPPSQAPHGTLPHTDDGSSLD
ncbi:hypothetical protein EVAR_8359_1 [Eumeta japonica]|uniref:Uncharacterized protein n=1 Tax=Eumeta variegata TaxID=151549 RepID=A0A4C1VCL9_EUMVA|nr:hypothetical protein EVAR_8359_1 [Eumeta japonica]